MSIMLNKRDQSEKQTPEIGRHQQDRHEGTMDQKYIRELVLTVGIGLILLGLTWTHNMMMSYN